ncbi:hypothetical protein HMPREF9103_01837 [Lentilactobacillus parafarraginis F0439]|uniref:Uncharacterized protein n=1 Tax=Lentilactobacillus parafarraginis F0439 TaxID=797515 RepID=G9ZQ32_9LACO|nr:hypothetical protein HMPREF9103_01837 [Lentilactobacillus parafarraginis F0439]
MKIVTTILTMDAPLSFHQLCNHLSTTGAPCTKAYDSLIKLNTRQ